jgi:hypothetical protein
MEPWPYALATTNAHTKKALMQLDVIVVEVKGAWSEPRCGAGQFVKCEKTIRIEAIHEINTKRSAIEVLAGRCGPGASPHSSRKARGRTCRNGGGR